MSSNSYDEEEAFPYKTIGTEQAKEMIDNGAIVVDVRRPDEWQRGHIAQAKHVMIEGIYSFGKNLSEQNLPKDQDVIFVCASGQRSAMASEIALLTGLDGSHVYNLANGMNGWVNRRYPVEY